MGIDTQEIFNRFITEEKPSLKALSDATGISVMRMKYFLKRSLLPTLHEIEIIADVLGYDITIKFTKTRESAIKSRGVSAVIL